jgi:hypothetical protein
MSETSEFDLLQDLARLLRKHGPEAFGKLAQRLGDPQFAEQLQQILSFGVRAAQLKDEQKEGSENQGGSAKDFRLQLVELGRADPERSALLVRLYDDLMAKTVLPTMPELRSFAQSSGLPVPRTSARARAVVEFLQSLQQQPLDEVRQAATRLPAAGGPGDRSLESWTRVIFDKSLRPKKAE